MKAKPFKYYHIEAMKMLYGIRAYAFGKWMPVARNGATLIFETEEERDAELKLVRKQKKVSDETR